MNIRLILEIDGRQYDLDGDMLNYNIFTSGNLTFCAIKTNDAGVQLKVSEREGVKINV